MIDVDEMEKLWTTKINHSLNFVAPWESRKMKNKRFCLPKEIQNEIKKHKDLQRQLQTKVQNGEVDLELEKKYKKHNNYCNKMIKKSVREKTGQNITNVSNVQEVWKSVNDILKPERISKNTLKIETDDKLIEDPLQLAETFNMFFKDKVENLASGIKKNKNIDPLLKLRNKLQDADLKFKLKTVRENKVLEILKLLKSKKSHGHDGISSEVLKLGAKVLVIPLTYIINTSILTGKYPTNWKTAKVIPLHKKGEKNLLKNYRPIALLSVAGMVLERVVAIQI
jgi:hypothetical protein